jgi:Fe2+/Zn2+ uptake regulation proteins
MQRRLTKQKELILDIVKNNYNHPTADEVYDIAVQRKSDISRGTVYRNLHLLAEEGYILEIPSPGIFPNRYDLNISRHFHVVCNRCGAMEDVDVSIPEPELKNIRNTGYEIESCEIIFRGLCPECQKSEKTGE